MGETIQIKLPAGCTMELPDPDLVLFYKNMEKRHVWLTDAISMETCGFWVQYINMLNLHETDDLTPITIHIASPGGDIEAMFMLYETIMNSKIPVHTVNEGGAHSAAFLIFLAGSKRTMNKYAHFVAHEGSGMLGGSYREVEGAMEQYKADVQRTKDMIVERTTITMEKLGTLLQKNQDWYINYEEALEHGIITE